MISCVYATTQNIPAGKTFLKANTSLDEILVNMDLAGHLLS